MKIKKIFKIILLVAFATILMSCSKNELKLKEGIYCITNPFSRGTIVINEKGNVLVRGDSINVGNYVTTIDDRETGKPICISKVTTGEEKITNTYEYEGNVESYSLPSERLELYDLNGNKLPFDKKGISYIDFGLGDYVYYNNYGDEKKFAYNVKTNEEKELKGDYFACDKGMIFLSSYAYTENDNKKKVEIYDKNLNLLKVIDGYTYEYEGEYNGKIYIRLAVYSREKDEYKYNYLDENLNLILKEPIYDESRKKNSDGISYEEINKLEDKFSEIDPNNSYVQVKKHNGITLYLVGYGYEDKTTGEYIYGTRIYDKDFKLCNDGIDTVESCFDEVGLILVNHDTFIDFNFNVVKKFDRKSEWQSSVRKGKIYFYDLFDEEYNSRDSFSLYDDKFNVIFKDIKQVNLNMIDDYMVIEDKDSTKLYDDDFKVYKDYGRHLEIYGWADTKSSCHSFNDKETNLMGVMDKDWNIIIDNLKDVGDMRDTYFTFQKGFRYGLMDYKGNVLIDFSIFDSTSDEDRQGADYMY